MNLIKKFISQYGYAIWLGGSCAALGFSCLSWQYWAINVPIITLVEFTRRLNDET